MSKYKHIPLKGSDRLVALLPADYELVQGYQWRLEDGAAVTQIGNELVEIGLLLRRLKGERVLLSGTPWRDRNN